MPLVVIEFLLPSWWEVQIAVVATAFVLVVYWIFSLGGGDCKPGNSSPGVANHDREEMERFRGPIQANSTYLVKVELLAARNLAGESLNIRVDPYAIITCCGEKRVSSMIPHTRNPTWREEFNFAVDELPAEVIVTINGRDMSQRSVFLGLATISVEHEGHTGATWHALNNAPGQVCVHIETLKIRRDPSRVVNVYAGSNAQRRAVDKQRPMVLHQKHGPLQTIFNLLTDEVAQHSYSCALERSFLYHGRMYISARHICFQSNVFSKQMKVIIAFGDIDEIRRSRHSLINPAVTIFLQVGAGEHGLPPPRNSDGRIKYKFTSFWNRNQSFKTLQHAVLNYRALSEAAQKEEPSELLDFIEEPPTLRVVNRRRQQRQQKALLGLDKQQDTVLSESSPLTISRQQSNVSEESAARMESFKPFIQEEILIKIYNDVFPCTAEQFFRFLLDDGSTFTHEYHTTKKDFNILVCPWHASEEYNGQVRDVTYRSLCNFPMCPPNIPVTEWQHAVLSADKRTLVFETIQQTEGVPFASYFEAQCRWSIETNSESLCTVDVKFGIRFKRWCLLQSRIKTAATDDNRKIYKIMLDAARSYIKSRTSDIEIENVAAASPFVNQASN